MSILGNKVYQIEVLLVEDGITNPKLFLKKYQTLEEANKDLDHQIEVFNGMNLTIEEQFDSGFLRQLKMNTGDGLGYITLCEYNE